MGQANSYERIIKEEGRTLCRKSIDFAVHIDKENADAAAATGAPPSLSHIAILASYSEAQKTWKWEG